MFKKILASIVFIICLAFIYQINFKPIFNDYAQTFQVCLNDKGSASQICLVNKQQFKTLKGVYGESCVVEKDLDANTILSDFKAKIVLVEDSGSGNSIYAYSSKIKNHVTINGRMVNLHIHTQKDLITVGSPIIYGSF